MELEMREGSWRKVLSGIIESQQLIASSCLSGFEAKCRTLDWKVLGSSPRTDMSFSTLKYGRYHHLLIWKENGRWPGGLMSKVEGEKVEGNLERFQDRILSIPDGREQQ